MSNILILLTALLAGNGQVVQHANAFQNAGGYARNTRTRSFVLSSHTTKEQCNNRLVNFHLRSTVKGSESSEAMVSDDREVDVDAASKFNWMRQWYPVLPVSFLNELDADKDPFGITICGEDLVIWKTASGEFSVLQDMCPHRRAQLSTGKVVSGNSASTDDDTNSVSEDSSFLACRYHGWQFDEDGSCVGNPMIPSKVEGGKGGFKMATKAFGVSSYKCQIKGLLLWVFMDPNESEPPAIPAEACKFVEDDDAEEDVAYSINLNPISWQSMVENMFDPSHAPFVHEGLAFGRPYSPDRAIPIETYDFKEQISNAGFTVEHSPYQLPPKSPKSPEPTESEEEEKANGIDSLPLTTRQFLAPVTCHAQSIIPNFNSTLYFVPTIAGETMTISLFKTGQSFLPPIPGFIPKKISSMVMDFVQLLLFIASDAQYKFLSQDRLIMQAQDKHKTSKFASSWEDMHPATADKGVKAFQSWCKKFGRPSFTMPPTSGEIEGRQLSIWESRAKFSPSCIRSIRRLGKIAKEGKRIANLSLMGSLVSAFLTLLTNKKREIMVIKSALLLLLSSVTSRWLASECLKILDKVYVNPTNLAKYKMMDIYAKAK